MSSVDQRLKLAREARGYASATSAAQAMGVPVATYVQHENGSRGLPTKRAAQYGRFFGVTPEWLLYGRGDAPKARPAGRPVMCEVVGRVGADPEGRILFSAGDRPFAYAPVPPGGSELMPVLQVIGDSMPGFAPNGSLIYLEEQRNPPAPDMIGDVVAVELDDGQVLLKRLLRGSGPKLWDLESISGPTLRDVRIVWAAFVYAVIPPRAARRIIVDLVDAA